LFFIPLTISLYIFSFFADSMFEVKISNLLFIFAPFTGLVLLQSHINLMLRGWGRVNLMAFVTILPRVIYIILLSYIILISSFTLQSSLSMWFLGFFLALSISFLCIRPNFTSIKKTSKNIFEEVKTYGIHLYISQIWHEILFHTDKFVISYFLSAESMAYYALGYMITFPLTHFSTALSSTLFKKFSGQEKINPKVHLVNGAFVVTSVIIFILLREHIIIYLFSDNYLPTIELIAPLALAFGFSGLSKPFSLYLMARKYGKTVRNISITIPVLHIAVGLYIIPQYGIFGAAWVAAGVYMVDMLLFMMSYLRIIRRQKNHP
jgi:O-antigen/teichoic acid export membrane protein